MAWDGCVRIPKGQEVDACALAKRSDVMTSVSNSHSFPVKLIQPLAAGAIAQHAQHPPHPQHPQHPQHAPCSSTTASSPAARGARARSPPTALRQWFTDEHILMLTEGAVSVTILVVAILTLVMLTRKQQH
jgi:hypothetical protein